MITTSVAFSLSLSRGQRMANELSANNPDLIESIQRNMRHGDPSQFDDNDDDDDHHHDSTSDNNPTGSPGMFSKQIDHARRSPVIF